MTLKGFLDEQLDDKEVVVNVQGVSGELVTRGMVERMKRFCEFYSFLSFVISGRGVM